MLTLYDLAILVQSYIVLLRSYLTNEYCRMVILDMCVLVTPFLCSCIVGSPISIELMSCPFYIAILDPRFSNLYRFGGMQPLYKLHLPLRGSSCQHGRHLGSAIHSLHCTVTQACSYVYYTVQGSIYTAFPQCKRNVGLYILHVKEM